MHSPSKFAGGALARVRPFQPDEHGAARRVACVADEPVVAFTATVGEIMAAHRLRLTRKTARELRGRALHEVAPRKRPASRRARRAEWFLLFGRYSAAAAWTGSDATRVSVTPSARSMADSPPIIADCSPPAGASGSLEQISALVLTTVRSRPRVRSGSGNQPEPASSSCAFSAMSPFLRCAMRCASASPFASRTASTMRALGTRPR